MYLLPQIFIAVVVISLILWFLQKINKNDDFYKDIPGPPTLPILGNALDFILTTEILDLFQNYTKKYGGICKIQVGPVKRHLLVSDYKLIEFVLNGTKLLTKSPEYRFFIPWLGTGLLTSDGKKWKTHRKILTPAFHFQILEQFVGVFESCGDILIQKFQEEVGKKSFDVYPYVTLCTMDIICESTMGVKVNAQINHDSEYVRSVHEITKIVVERLMSVIQMYDFLFPLSKNFYTQKKVLKILHAQSNSVIEERLKSKKKEHSSDCYEDQFGVKKRKAFLDLLLEATIDGKPLTKEEIREEVDTFMFEGQDTTASVISFSLYCLANHPDIQRKVLDEQKEIFENKDDSTVTHSDLQKMRYLELVIKETLRLYPPAAFYGRETKKDVEYEGKRLPAGDFVIIFPFALHRNPKYFKNPEEFNPDRFEESDGKFPYAYIPFSAGPRNCIGQKFAMLEMKSTISKIVRQFELEPASPEHVLKLAGQGILKSANGIKIGIKLRR